jgi:dipeptidyl aminopeptidase/acylaminoacyl peptidase
LNKKSIHDVPLIERSKLFGNPERMSTQISPDGKFISWLAPFEGALNLWVAPVDDRENAKVLTRESRRGLSCASWTYDSEHLMFLKDDNGDENMQLHVVNATSGEIRNLTAMPGVRVNLVAVSKHEHLRGKVLIQVYKRDPRFGDLYIVNIATGKLDLVLENPGFGSFVVNDRFDVLLGRQSRPDGGATYAKFEGGAWKPWLSFDESDVHCSRVLHVDASMETLYLIDARGRDTGALVSIPLAAANGDDAPVTVILENEKADIAGVFVDSRTYTPLAAAANYLRRDVEVLDPAFLAEVTYLNTRFAGEWHVSSRTEDDRTWVITESSDRMPGAAFLYDRTTREQTLLNVERPELDGLPLARMQSTTIRTRDGLDMVSYLTLPVHADDHARELASVERLPMVLLVHGGPWARDTYGYNGMHQWLANRGYAVLSVNFRGSTGFGKNFAAAVNGEWGGKMDDDLTDAVDWAVERGIADPARIAIMGGSYGGYAVLWALTHHKDKYACGVDIVGPANLETLIESVPAYWESFKAKLYAAVGDPRTEDGLRLLKARSPLTFAHQVARPLLIGQGANDPRVRQAESDQMVSALKDKGIPYTYVLFPDEGHGFARPVNMIKFNILTEEFLSRHIGGRTQAEVAHECDGNTAIIASLG